MRLQYYYLSKEGEDRREMRDEGKRGTSVRGKKKNLSLQFIQIYVASHHRAAEMEKKEKERGRRG